MEDKNKYIKTSSYEAKKGEFKRCLLLYSGGLDTSVMLKWIQETYDCEIITLTLDIGQTCDNLEEIRKKAIKLGAKKAIVYDGKKEFASHLLSKAIKANANYQDGYALSTPLGRIIISQIAVKIAKKENCSVIAHGCTGKGNDQVRFDGYITTLSPDLKIIAPVREWGMGRLEEIEYAKKNKIPIKQQKEKPYSYDENMWGNTGEGGEIENVELAPKTKNILQWCKTLEDSQKNPETVSIEFFEGVPIKLNGKKLELHKLILECNKVGAKHGVGVFTLIEDRLVGLKVRGVYENPGASILIEAHKKLEKLVSTREENELKIHLDTKWAYLTYAAKWFDPVLNNINSFIDCQNKKVCGVVNLKLFRGNIEVISLKSKYSLFDENLATFEKNQTFNQNASAGFIEIYNLSQKTAFNVSKNLK